MEISLDDLKALPVDWASLGIYGIGGEPSWCTPAGGKVFMDTCQQVGPLSDPPARIVAEDMTHFLALLAITQSVWAIEQIHMFTFQQYQDWLTEAAKTPGAEEAARAANTLKSTYSLSDITDPYEYVKQLQSNAPCVAANLVEAEEIYEESDTITCYISNSEQDIL